MKIYTEIVWSWDDERGELVRESSKSYDYEGPLTLFNDNSVESTIAAQAYGHQITSHIQKILIPAYLII